MREPGGLYPRPVGVEAVTAAAHVDRQRERLMAPSLPHPLVDRRVDSLLLGDGVPTDAQHDRDRVLNRDPDAGAAQFERPGDVVGRLDVLGSRHGADQPVKPSQASPSSTGVAASSRSLCAGDPEDDRSRQYRTLGPRPARMRIRRGLAVSPHSTGSWAS